MLTSTGVFDFRLGHVDGFAYSVVLYVTEQLHSYFAVNADERNIGMHAVQNYACTSQCRISVEGECTLRADLFGFDDHVKSCRNSC
mgnify:CR=1 FL=1